MPGQRKKKTRKTSKPSRRRWLIRVLLVLLAALGVYLGYLNYLINERFEGDAWALPSRVFARPLELYPGLALNAQALKYELELSSYLEVERAPAPGQYRRLGASLELHARPFDFGDDEQPARTVQVFFDDGRVDGLVDSVSGSKLALFRLPPVVLGSYYPRSGEDRLILGETQVPQRLVDTLIAVEDRRFHDHFGVSPQDILRALWVNLRAGKTVQGGSTLTQQLAKNMFLTPERTLLRKINEAFMALLLEARFSKRAILAAYINEVFLLQQNRVAIHGFERASRMLFRRSVDHLEPQHIALLVGMVKGPTRYNPLTRVEAALARRNLVLEVMLEQGVIEPGEYELAVAKPLGVVERLPGVNPFPAYLDLVKRQLRANYANDELDGRGLRVFTAFDPLLQQSLETGLRRGLARFEQPELQAAVVIADYLSGEVRALVGDRVTDYPGFNRALMAQRPIGSLIKPLLLYSLLQQGNTLASTVVDEPIRIKQSDGKIWEPRNYDQQLHGRMTLFRAFVHSYNLPFVHLGVDGGLELLADNLARMRLLKHDIVYPSILLGTTAMSAFEAAQMFQVIANNGYFAPLTSIRRVSDAHNRVLERRPLDSYALFDQATMIQVQRAMIGVGESGTARYLGERFGGRSIAGKTGTTNAARDSWFAGFTRRLLGVVWLGRDDNLPINLTGSTGALRVWADIMEAQGFESFRLTPDDSLEWRSIDAVDGGIAQKSCADGVLLPFPNDRVPRRRSACR
ncbi:MAG: penicillin-binding protein 1B [Gammaproteobacteria bacterium]|nr:penicillin-binding protein 1B [Gammaproteobacteria bacterium]